MKHIYLWTRVTIAVLLVGGAVPCVEARGGSGFGAGALGFGLGAMTAAAMSHAGSSRRDYYFDDLERENKELVNENKELVQRIFWLEKKMEKQGRKIEKLEASAQGSVR